MSFGFLHVRRTPVLTGGRFSCRRPSSRLYRGLTVKRVEAHLWQHPNLSPDLETARKQVDEQLKELAAIVPGQSRNGRPVPDAEALKRYAELAIERARRRPAHVRAALWRRRALQVTAVRRAGPRRCNRPSRGARRTVSGRNSRARRAQSRSGPLSEPPERPLASRVRSADAFALPALREASRRVATAGSWTL